MTTVEVDGRVRKLFILHLDVAPDELMPEARLNEDLCIDSLTAVELLMILEDDFDIALPEDEVGDLSTFADLIAVVADRVASRF